MMIRVLMHISAAKRASRDHGHHNRIEEIDTNAKIEEAVEVESSELDEEKPAEETEKATTATMTT